MERNEEGEDELKKFLPLNVAFANSYGSLSVSPSLKPFLKIDVFANVFGCLRECLRKGSPLNLLLPSVFLASIEGGEVSDAKHLFTSLPHFISGIDSF